jgi:hypothetical protein
MEQIYIDRLNKLADHLDHGKLGHKLFDFGSWNRSWNFHGQEYDENGCGYQGCAIGECPILFPDEWEFVPDGSTFDPVLKDLDVKWPALAISRSIEKFFGLNDNEIDVVFVGYNQSMCNEGMYLQDSNIQQLPQSATKEEVAENIRKFIKWKTAQSL